MTQILNSPAEFKFAAAEGVVEGYAAVFGNRDLGGDVIVPGAFQQVSKTRDGRVLVLYHHDPRSPIGKAEVVQDSLGLQFKAQLMMDDPIASRASLQALGMAQVIAKSRCLECCSRTVENL